VLPGGRASVILFFVLSGFALSLAVRAGASFGYRTFLLRRLCSIYLPFAVAILLAAMSCRLVTTGPMPGMGPEFNNYWTVGFASWPDIRDLLLMLGRYRDTILDAPVWSLAHELRISLIFPLLYAAARRAPRAVAAARGGRGVDRLCPNTRSRHRRRCIGRRSART
jgi:peptidoglycan/LPS O-acetylase OafA/YrhL